MINFLKIMHYNLVIFQEFKNLKPSQTPACLRKYLEGTNLFLYPRRLSRSAMPCNGIHFTHVFHEEKAS